MLIHTDLSGVESDRVKAMEESKPGSKSSSTRSSCPSTSSDRDPSNHTDRSCNFTRDLPPVFTIQWRGTSEPVKVEKKRKEKTVPMRSPWWT